MTKTEVGLGQWLQTENQEINSKTSAQIVVNFRPGLLSLSGGQLKGLCQYLETYRSEPGGLLPFPLSLQFYQIQTPYIEVPTVPNSPSAFFLQFILFTLKPQYLSHTLFHLSVAPLQPSLPQSLSSEFNQFPLPGCFSILGHCTAYYFIQCCSSVLIINSCNSAEGLLQSRHCAECCQDMQR